MREKITGFILLAVIVIVTGLIIWQQPAEQLTLEASTDTVANVSAVTVGSKKYTVELAVTEAEKSQGLSGRSNLEKNRGMLFVFVSAEQQSFWMKDMKFALDMVWVADNKVVGVERNVPMPLPGTTATDLPLYTPPTAVNYVLELSAGEAASINIGDDFALTTAEGV